MKVAIVILNWNGKKWLEKFLPSVVKYSDNAQLYVIDNASTDDSNIFLSENYPDIKIIHNHENYGFAEGYNKGLKYINADIFCLLNSDVEVTENWLYPIIELFSKNKEIAVIQPKIKSYERKDYFEFAGAAGGFIDNLGYPYCRGRIFDELEKDNGQYDDISEIFWASGCAFFIRTSDFWNQNGFDERFFAYQEEIDLCWRLKNSGRRIFYTYKSVVYHVGGGSLNKQSPQKTYLNFRNNLSMLLKNLPKKYVFWIIMIRLFLDGIAGIRFCVKDGVLHLLAVVRAHFSFYLQALESIRRRKKQCNYQYFQKKWLVFEYFLKF